MTRTKFRIRFRKAGDLQFLSHHDLLRAFERMLRRAELPFRSSAGFHPKPKMAFASALGLGIVGHQEVVEIEFDGFLAAEDVHRKLTAQAPSGLEIISVRSIDPRQSAHACRARYRVRFDTSALPDLPERVAALRDQPECWVERAKPHPKRVNIRSYLLDIAVGDEGLTFDVAITPTGSARPEDVLQLLGLSEIPMNGAALERTALEIADETQERVMNRGDEGQLCTTHHSPLTTRSDRKDSHEEGNVD